MHVIPHLHAFPVRVDQSLAKIWNAHKLHYEPIIHQVGMYELRVCLPLLTESVDSLIEFLLY